MTALAGKLATLGITPVDGDAFQPAPGGLPAVPDDIRPLHVLVLRQLHPAYQTVHQIASSFSDFVNAMEPED